MKRFARRDWGWWFVMWSKPHFKIKLLYFKKGQSISMQRHKWRSELWLFLKGKGCATNSYRLSDAFYPCKKGDFLLIDKTKWHKYTATKRTIVLEIQFGSLCCENDIERKYENI